MKKTKLKYNEKWFKYGFINETELTNQIEEFEKGEDPYAEHYRYKSFLNFIRKNENFEDEEIANYIELVELDTHVGMASSALVDLFKSKKLTSTQMKNVGEKLMTFGDWAKKVVKKELDKMGL